MWGLRNAVERVFTENIALKFKTRALHTLAFYSDYKEHASRSTNPLLSSWLISLAAGSECGNIMWRTTWTFSCPLEDGYDLSNFKVLHLKILLRCWIFAQPFFYDEVNDDPYFGTQCVSKFYDVLSLSSEEFIRMSPIFLSLNIQSLQSKYE